MENSFSILIWTNKSKKNNQEKAPLYGRITINGKRTEVALKIFVELERWDSQKSRMKGNKEDARLVNNSIENFILRIRKIYEQLKEENAFLSADKIKNIYLGVDNKRITLKQAFEIHIKEIEKKIGIDFAKGTVIKYRTSLKHIESYLKQYYKRNDIELVELDYSFISKFEFFLKVEKANAQNSTCKHIQRLRKIINLAILNEWIEKDPFKKFSIKQEIREREFLTREEIEKIEQKEFIMERLNNVKDIFIFSCYTGLSYVDISNLTEDNLYTGIDGEKWIKIKRQKTGSPSSLPLLPRAVEILEKYKDSRQTRLLPILSNQKMNSYLKEIADICGIKKNLTFHMARHSFATSITLTNGVPIETVSKMLGHRSIKTTQIYSKVVEQKVSYDMKLLKEKLENKISFKKAN